VSTAIIVGAGLAGLSGSLFLARRGHEVTLIERDAVGVDDLARLDSWTSPRPGVPQACQSHIFLGRSCSVLSQEAPDVLTDLLEAEAYRVDFNERFPGGTLHSYPGDNELWALGCRRTTYEAILRKAVQAEPHIRTLTHTTVGRLIRGRATAGLPTIVGVRTMNGLEITADLVVDASGYRSGSIQWFSHFSDLVPDVWQQNSGFTYLTRWYRLRPGRAFPKQRRLPYADGFFASVAAFPADLGYFSLSYMAPAADPLRLALRDPAVFDAVLSRFALTNEWLDNDLAEPISDVLMMPGGKDRRVDMMSSGHPRVVGMVGIGDAYYCTNPTRGRGTSMAFIHAQLLAHLSDRLADDPVGFATEFNLRTQSHIVPWFEETVTMDRSRLARMQDALKGDYATEDHHLDRAISRIADYAAIDDVVYRAFIRILNMLEPSDVALARPEVRSRISDLSTSPVAVSAFDGPSRKEFMRLTGDARPSRS
jgi:2-polyprenyl-6-methoxyphenol hydroxylase-like FAD-dependent oxidoreductase